MKRFSCGLLAVVMAAGLMTVPASAVEFSDVQDHWAQTAIQQVTDWELFTGNDKGEFMPDATMTRGMFVTVMERCAKMMGVYQQPEQTATFIDVQPSDYFASGVSWSQASGLVTGVGGDRFAPNDPITREQMCVIMDRFLRTFTDYDLDAYLVVQNAFLDKESIGDYAKQSVDLCVALGLIQGVSVEGGMEFQPVQPATRAAVAVILGRLVPVFKELPPIPEQPGGTEGGGTEGGGTEGGGTEGGGTEGGGQKPTDPEEPTEQEKADEAKMAEYLQVMVDNYNNSSYLPTTDQQVQDCMAILMGAISDALVQRQNGQFLDRTFVREQYADQISHLHTEYNKLTEDQLNQMNNVIVRLGDSEQIYFVMDYFGVSMDH